MKITYFNYLYDIEGVSAGSAVKAKEFVSALRNLGHEVTLHWRHPQAIPQEERSDIRTRLRNRLKTCLAPSVHEPKKLMRNAKNLLEEAHILRTEKPDLLFSRLELLYLSSLLVAKWRRIPFVVEADCPPAWEFKHQFGKNFVHMPGVLELVDWINLRLADSIIVISSELKRYYERQGIPGEKMTVIPNGADPEKFRPQAKDPEIWRACGGPGRTVVGWIGSLAGWSGLENLISVAHEILDIRDQVCFLFVGGEPNYSALKESFKDHGLGKRVILPGRVPHSEVPRYLSVMDVVIAPYPRTEFWYPSSMKLFEYMASGKAILASGVAQIVNVIQDGRNGHLFDPEDRQDFLNKLLHLIDHQKHREALGQQARQDVIDQYSWEGHARKMVEVFERVLENHNGVRSV